MFGLKLKERTKALGYEQTVRRTSPERSAKSRLLLLKLGPHYQQLQRFKWVLEAIKRFFSSVLAYSSEMSRCMRGKNQA